MTYEPMTREERERLSYPALQAAVLRAAAFRLSQLSTVSNDLQKE